MKALSVILIAPNKEQAIGWMLKGLLATFLSKEFAEDDVVIYKVRSELAP
jgi:hypothetical protein